MIAGLAALWVEETDSVLPLPILMPMIIYGLFLATLVFLWVLANELSTSTMHNRRTVQWARTHLLQFSQYAGLPLIIALATQWATQWHRSSSHSP
ncbi:MAG: hypothetical protein R3E79_20785 [Caldilineaceae bacterium]